MKARRWFVSGRVQGVGFRWFVERAAASLSLEGYTRNLDDGRVEVYAIGPERALSELCARLWQGPAGADVRGIEENEAPVEKVTGFRLKHV